MRRKRDTQGWLEFQLSNLKLTNDHFARYEAISEILDQTPELLELVHRDLRKALKSENRRRKRKGAFRITSDTVLRMTLCQIIEGASLDGGYCSSSTVPSEGADDLASLGEELHIFETDETRITSVLRVRVD